MDKIELKEFLDNCISSGSVIMSNNIKLSHSEILEIEDILNRFNDKTARTKIKKIINKNLEKYEN
jgi:hypothetical protein